MTAAFRKRNVRLWGLCSDSSGKEGIFPEPSPTPPYNTDTHTHSHVPPTRTRPSTPNLSPRDTLTVRERVTGALFSLPLGPKRGSPSGHAEVGAGCAHAVPLLLAAHTRHHLPPTGKEQAQACSTGRPVFLPRGCSSHHGPGAAGTARTSRARLAEDAAGHTEGAGPHQERGKCSGFSRELQTEMASGLSAGEAGPRESKGTRARIRWRKA